MAPGSVFLFQCELTGTVTMTSGVVTSLYTDGNLAVQVIPSTLVARISGSDRNVYVAAAAPPIVLDAGTSFDPDSVSPSAGLLAAWTCIRAVSLSPCFNASFSSQLATPATTQIQLTLPSLLFAPSYNDSFVFAVTISKDNRATTSAAVKVTGISVALPLLSVNILVPTQGPQWVKITPTDSVQMIATLTPISAVPVAYLYAWTCLSNNINISQGSPALTSSPQSTLLALQAGALVGGATYVFTFVVTSIVDTSVTSSYNVSFTVNAPPSGGSCSILSYDTGVPAGIAMTTTFNALCQNWLGQADDFPFQYSLASYTVDRSRERNIFNRFQLGALMQVLLPSGIDNAGQPAPLQLGVSIRNRWGSTTLIFLTVNVSNPDVSTPSAVAALGTRALSGVTLAAQSGNLDSAAQFAGPLNVALTAAAGSPGGNEGIAQRTALRAQVFDALSTLVNRSSGSSNTDPRSATQAMLLLSSIVAVPAEVSPAVQVAAAGLALSAASAQLASATTPFASSFAQSVLSIVSSVSTASASSNFSTSATTTGAAAVSSSTTSAVTTLSKVCCYLFSPPPFPPLSRQSVVSPNCLCL